MCESLTQKLVNMPNTAIITHWCEQISCPLTGVRTQIMRVSRNVNYFCNKSDLGHSHEHSPKCGLWLTPLMPSVAALWFPSKIVANSSTWGSGHSAKVYVEKTNAEVIIKECNIQSSLDANYSIVTKTTYWKTYVRFCMKTTLMLMAKTERTKQKVWSIIHIMLQC